ncbi:MAG TPA: TetR family transcriptional regulator [Ktedonobacteraceae bacterium]|nr:TetR family transcriptional regulator [Ktedonobacteraceae bacterium]
MRRTKEDAAITREQLLKAALHIFREKGYVETTLDDIAKEAGTTRGAVYWHFGNKAELFNTVIREQYIRMSKKLLDAQPKDGTPLQILRSIALMWMVVVEEDPEFRAMLEMLIAKTGLVPELEKGIQDKIQGTRAIIQYYADLIRQGIASGEIRPDVKPELAATTMLGMVNGVSNIWLFDPSSFSLKAYAEGAVDIFIRGIALTENHDFQKLPQAGVKTGK